MVAGRIRRDNDDRMSELWISHDSGLNMHVKGEVDTFGVDVPRELSESELNAQKAMVRGILVSRLEMIWEQVEPYIKVSLGDGTDVRMAKLGLDVIDRLIKLHEVLQPDRPAGSQGHDEVITAQRRQAILADLEARVTELT